jgi:two-component system sensor histidine kinase VanS
LRSEQKPNYRLFKRKFHIKIILIAVAALISVLLIRLFASSNNIGDMIVHILQQVFNITHENAHSFYWRYIRRNSELITFITVVVFFIILSRTLISQFTKYFHEISDGLDTLVEERERMIKLSPEMASMESKLVTIKQTLSKREQEAKLAEQRKNEVVMYLAHDIKTPLTSVVGYLSLLDEAPDMPIEQKAKYTKITLEKAHQLEKLVDEFFDVTRYNLQTISLKKEKIDLYYMLAQMTEEFYPLLAGKEKQITLTISEDMIVHGDPDQLARVFKNILKNAIAYSVDGSTINISATVAEQMTMIAFRNVGSVPTDNLSSIFDKFYRLDSARSSETGGAGLGLAIAKEIITAHGGTIAAASDDEHTTFTVGLPVGG